MKSGNRLSRRAQLAGGQPISELMARALAQPELISLAAGFVDAETLPVEPTRTALEAMLCDGAAARAALQYGTTPGYPPLREALLDRLQAADGRPASERGLSLDQTIVTAGSNPLLHLVVETLLDPRDIVLVSAPSYFVFLGMLGNMDLRAVGVASDAQGVIPAALEEELARREGSGERDRVKAIYLCSYFDNPNTSTLPADRRAEIVEIAQRWSRRGKIHVLEDIAYRELRYAGDDVPSMRAFDERGDTVIVAGTFSKSFSPGLRVGWGVLPPHLVGPVCSQKGNLDFGSPNFTQHLIAKVLEMGLYDEHVQRLRAAYRAKLRAMLDAADEHLGPIDGADWQVPEGGLYVWLKLPEDVDTGPDGQLFDLALAEGMMYVPGQYFYPSEGVPAARNMIRLSFGVQSPENIARGMAALARAVRSL